MAAEGLNRTVFENHRILKYFHNNLFETHASRDYIMKDRSIEPWGRL